MKAKERDLHARGRPSFWLALLASLAVIVPMEYLRFAIYDDQIVPLMYVLPLLMCLWHRYLRLLWGMAAVFVVLSFIKLILLSPSGGADQWVFVGIRVANILIGATVIHVLIVTRGWLEQKNAELEAFNAELQASNEELAAREEEVSRQNEELQSQTEELQEQNEELNRQGEEMQSLNEELTQREKAIQTLMGAAQWGTESAKEQDVLAAVCRAAMQVMEDVVTAAAVVEREGDELVVRGHCGFGPEGPARDRWRYDRSLAALVMERKQTGYLEDVAAREDLETVQPADGDQFRSLLAAPLCIGGCPVGAVEVFSREPRQWTQESFRVIEWLAGQASIVLQSFRQRLELEERRSEAEDASIRKTRFLAAVSHDVRTPANAISLMAELIVRSANDPGMTAQLPELAGDLRENARSLVALVSDVLDLARFESGRLELQVTEFSASSLLEAEIRQLMPIVQEKGLTLTHDRTCKDFWLRTDRMKLARIVANLIGNAIKFTETGGVAVVCGRTRDGGAEVRVTDSGIGIAPDHLARIFDEFFQLRNPERDRMKGTGLGLAISKRLADALGCRLSVRSTVGQGSAFTLSIPPSLVVERSTVTATATPSPQARDGALAGTRILLVEDHDTTRIATARLLKAEGATVYQAENGQTALHMLAHEDPEVLLLDLMLPDIDGSEVLRHLQQRRPPSLRRVLAVSGDVTASRRAQIETLGADGLMPKPINIEALVAAIAPGEHEVRHA